MSCGNLKSMVFERRKAVTAERRARRLSVGLASAILAATLGPSAARADFYFHPWENQGTDQGEFRLLPEAWLYSSTQNLDELGAASTPSGFSSYSRLQVDALARFGFARDWTIYGRMAWASVDVDSSTLAGSSFGLPDQTVGINWRVWQNDSAMSISLQGQIDFPGYSNQGIEANIPFMGDGSMDLSAGGFLSIPLDGADRQTWWATGGVGFTFRTAGFSQAIPWSLAIRHEPREAGLRLDVGAFGFQSMGTDANPPSTEGAGGSFVVNAVNPSLVSVRGKLGYRFNDKLSILGGATVPLFGSNSPTGTVVSFGLEFNWGPKGGQLDKRTMTPNEYGHSNKGFVNYAFDAHVLRINDRLNMFKIDKGRLSGVEQGQSLDVFEVRKDGSVGEAIARAKVMSVKSDEAVLKVVEYYKEIWIEEGFVVKRPLD